MRGGFPANYTIEHFRANLQRLRIGATQELRDSFAGTLVSAASGDGLKLRLAYVIRGMYVDMGVGRGLGAGVTRAVGLGERGRDYNELRNACGQLLAVPAPGQALVRQNGLRPQAPGRACARPC